MTQYREIECLALHSEILAAIHAECFDNSWNAASFSSLLAGPAVTGLLTVKSDQTEETPVGFILLQTAADECEILTLAVLPACRRTGVASGLLNNTLSLCIKNEIRNIFLEVAKNNQGARDFYACHKFRDTGVRPNYYAMNESRVDAIMMARDIGY